MKQGRAAPIVDFSKDRLVVVFLGTKSSGGYSAQVSQVVGMGGTSATVFINEVYPNPKQSTTQMMTSPWVMFAIDRSYLDIQAKFQRVQDNSFGSIPIGLGGAISFTPLPWDLCGYGYGGNWNDPCGYGFDSPYDFQNWCNQNNCEVPNYSGINFQQNRLVFISGGDFGLGYGLQIGDIFLSGSETVVQVRRGAQTSVDKRSFLLVALGRESKKYSVEYLASDYAVTSGYGLPVRQPGAWVFRSNEELGKVLDMSSFVPPGIEKVDYAKNNLGLVYLNEKPNITTTVDRVAYRGNVAYVYLKRGVLSPGFANMNIPYFVLKLDRKVRSIKVVG